MGRKIFCGFLILSILTLLGLSGWYYLERQQNLKIEPNVVIPNIQGIPNEEPEKEPEGEKKEPTYKPDVYSVHLCDRYEDGTFSIRNIKLGMTFREVVNIELKNIGVYVENSEYGKDSFYAMASKDNQGKDLLPVRERALLGNACDIVYNFSTDITVENPDKYPFLDSVQFQFTSYNENADKQKKIEDAFSYCFGKPVIEIEGKYSVSTFTGPNDKIQMFYEYFEGSESFNLRYIIWEKFTE